MPSHPHTPAHAEEHQNGSYLFKLGDTDPISHVFEVADVPVVIKAFGLQTDDTLIVDMVIGTGSGDQFEAVRLHCGCAMRMNDCLNVLVLGISGRYRLRYTWRGGESVPDNMGEFIVVQHKTNIQVTVSDMLAPCCNK
jgi:hypothetical protein